MTQVIDQQTGKNWAIYHADCVEGVKGLPDNSIGFSVFSPPFSSLYTYSNSDRDMGNCKDDEEFFEHFRFLAPELFRVTMPGRLVSFHCMNLPISKQHHGEIGLRDFRGDLIRIFEAAGWIFHSEVCIWKDPVTAMQRTKALGLLHKQILKDSCMSRQGIPDYLVTMRKPGKNSVPVSGPFETFSGDKDTAPDGRLSSTRYSIEVWQRYASPAWRDTYYTEEDLKLWSPLWMDINPSDTLQRESAREEKDERHICPLQLQVISRALDMWSVPGDTVLSPFTGIGSEGYQAVKMGRKFIGFELKGSYFKQACLNLKAAESAQEQELPLT
jgi:hypothetical protein